MRVNFTVGGITVHADRRAANIAHARSLGLPSVAALTRERRALNIIGRGPSVARHIQTLKADDADAWACGSAFAWCRDNGIDATFLSADAHPMLAGIAVGAKRAILADQTDPAVFEALRSAEIYVYDSECDAGGTTAVCAAVTLAACAGYSDIRLYGCDGSYDETTHVNSDEPQLSEMLVRCDGREFRTNPQMIMQSENLAEAIAGCPAEGLEGYGELIKDHSGGLLSALIASGGEWELLCWDNAPANVAMLMNSGNPGWGDDGAADAAVRGAA